MAIESHVIDLHKCVHAFQSRALARLSDDNSEIALAFNHRRTLLHQPPNCSANSNNTHYSKYTRSPFLSIGILRVQLRCGYGLSRSLLVHMSERK